jgi:DNA-binding MarR family transcriptional regulator
MPDKPTHATDPCFCTFVRQASRHLSQFYDAALGPVGISVNQYAVLARIERLGPRAMGDLAANLVMDRSTLGRVLRPLEARGLIELRASPDDRRRRALALTEKGTALLQAARPLWAQAQRRFEALYGTDASRQLCGLLESVIALDLDTSALSPPAA